MSFIKSFPIKIALACILIVNFYSCSKDSDLLSEYVVSKNDNIQSISLLADDTFYIAPGQSSLLLDVLNNDTFTADSQITIVATSIPNNGEVTINENNTLTYVPQNSNPETEEASPSTNDTATDEDSFTYTAEVTTTDNITYREEANVTINANNQNLVKAFPTAFGGGSIATGGRGKILAIINTLDPKVKLTHHTSDNTHDEYYTGGLFAAMQNPNVGYIVFNVSGNIDLGVGGTGKYFDFDGIDNVNNKTIFGQSAPLGGITLTGGTFRISGKNENGSNLIIRYIRSRPIYNRNGIKTGEDDAYTWAFLFYGGEKIILDHCSASFAQDKAIGAYIIEPEHRIKNITFSNNFIQDSGTGAYVEINPGRLGDPEENVDFISFYSNVFLGVNRTPNLAFSGRAEKINNIIQDTPFKQTSSYHSLKLNEIANYYSGSNSKNKIREDLIDKETSGIPTIFSSENYFNGLLYGNLNEDNSSIWTLKDPSKSVSSMFMTKTMFNGFPNPLLWKSPQNAFKQLINDGDVGAYKYLDNNGEVKIFRDPFDTSQLKIIAENGSYTSRNMNNWNLPIIPNNQRPEAYDSDNDGMADKWELKVFGNLNQSYRGDYDNNGYDNIEDYMNQVDN